MIAIIAVLFTSAEACANNCTDDYKERTDSLSAETWRYLSIKTIRKGQGAFCSRKMPICYQAGRIYYEVYEY